MDRTIISFDYAIKTILRQKANFGILSGFLSELLGKKVVVKEILESESNKIDPKDKVNRLDLKAKIDKGEVVIFEIQFADQIDFFQKVLFGVSKAVSEQIGAGGKYGDIKKVYSIDIVYFELGKGSDYIYHGITDFRGLHNNEPLLFSSDEKELLPEKPAGELFPEYYLIYPRKFDENIKVSFDEWVYTLKKSAVKPEFTAAGIREAGDKLDELKMSSKERALYERHLDVRRNSDSIIDTAVKKAMIKGEERGKKLGEKIGEERGKKLGEKIGEQKAKIEIAQKLLKSGLNAEEVAKIAELTAEDVNKLK